MAVAFSVLAAFQLWFGSSLGWLFVVIAAAFGGTAWLHPSSLRPLNYVWFRFGLLLHRVVSPVVMAAMFFGAVLPIGLLMRLFGARPLALKPDPAAMSYWVARAGGTPPPGSMKKQF